MIQNDAGNKKVTQWLNEVDYEVNNAYVPSEFALGFVNFIKMVNGGEGEENKSPVVHYRMLDNIVGKKKDTVNMCHRGMGKTAILGEYLFLYLACYRKIPGFGDVSLALYVSDSIENGVKNMRKNLEHRYNNSDFLQTVIPFTRFTDVRWEFKNVSNQTLIIKGYGAKTGVRGAKEMAIRPVLAVLDDLVSDEDARSDTVIASIEDTIYKAVDYALHPTHKKIIWSGTPFNSKDPLYKAVESGAWAVNVYPVCEKFPCSEEEFKGSWSDRFTYQYVKNQYDKAIKAGKVDTFNQELMLRIMSDEDRLIKDGDIQWFNWVDVVSHRSLYNFYVTTDFATSEKESADFSVISVWAINNSGAWFWVDGVCKRQDMSKNIDDLFKLVARYKPLSVGVEVTGQQGGFITWLQNEMVRRNNIFALASDNNSGAPGIRPNTNKMVRFNTVVPLFKTQKIFFPLKTGLPSGDLDQLQNMIDCLDEAMNELTLAAPNGFRSKKDDFIDTISMLTVMNAFPPSEEAKMRKDEHEARRGVNIWEFDEIPEDTNSPIANYI